MRNVTRVERKTGKFNQREIDVTNEEILKLLNIDQANESIGFATPYRKQVEKASSQLPAMVETDTIHKYQGREKDIIIMSTVLDSTRSGKIGIRFVDDPHLVNVAVSRAIKQFILVTDFDLFQHKGQHIRDLFKYIRYTTLDKGIVDSQIVSVFVLLYQQYSQKLISLQKKLMNKSKFKSENIAYTLINDILAEEKYSDFSFAFQVYLKNLICEMPLLSDEEVQYIDNGASVDFVIYYKQDKQCAGVIEIDGFEAHENNPKQLLRDAKKNSIFSKCKIPSLRLSTIDINAEEEIRALLAPMVLI